MNNVFEMAIMTLTHLDTIFNKIKTDEEYNQ